MVVKYFWLIFQFHIPVLAQKEELFPSGPGGTKTVQRLYTIEGLAVNPAKISMVAITKRRSLQWLKELKFWEPDVPLKKEVKYLGLTLDTRMTFKSRL